MADLIRDLSRDEVSTLMRLSVAEGVAVRLVDPVSQHVIDVDGNVLSDEVCSMFWGRCERCENCTSLKALRTRGIAYKLELLRDRTYLVMSRFLCVDGRECILEVVSDITDSLFMDGSEVDEVGKIIHSYNYQLVTDPLTNIYNRRFLDEYFLPSLGCCHESDVVSVCILDLDGFKGVNDKYGHQAGDALLKDVAGFWKMRYDSREKNAERLVIRYGGDEMLIIVCGMDSGKFATEISESYREMRKTCYCEGDTEIRFSISFGIASSAELGGDWEWDSLFALADKRLYQHKTSKGKADRR